MAFSHIFCSSQTLKLLFSSRLWLSAYGLAFYLTHFCPFSYFPAQAAPWGLCAPWSSLDVVEDIYLVSLSCKLIGNIFLKPHCQEKLSLLNIWFLENVYTLINIVTDHASHFIFSIGKSEQILLSTLTTIYDPWYSILCDNLVLPFQNKRNIWNLTEQIVDEEGRWN